MKCGIVILNYNDYDTTKSLLDMIKNYTSLDYIVVVDNHSTDDSYKNLLKYSTNRITILLAPGNNGYSKGNNIGIKYLIDNTDVDIIGVSNSDVEFDEGFIIKIKEDFEKKKEYSVITGLQISQKGDIGDHPFWMEYTTKQWFAMKSSCLYLMSHLSGNKTYAQRYIKYKLDNANSFIRVGAVEGSLFFIKRNDFESIGLLDEGVWLYCEEDILAKKIKMIKKKIGVDKSIKYVHYGAKTTNKVFSNKDSIIHTFNSSIYYFNNYQTDNRILQILNFIICSLVKYDGLIRMRIRNMKG